MRTIKQIKDNSLVVAYFWVSADQMWHISVAYRYSLKIKAEVDDKHLWSGIRRAVRVWLSLYR